MSYAIILAALIGIILGGLIFYFLSRLLAKGEALPAEAPRFSEREAEGLLRRAGYQIISKKQRETIITVIDGKERFGYLEADYLVRKNKRRLVVVVPTGEGNSDPNEPALRRRLLEYDRVFAADGLLVLDLNRGEVHSVRFKFPREWNIDVFFRLLIAIFIIALVIGIIWMLTALRLF